MQIITRIQLDIEDIVSALTADEAVELIKRIELEQADWDFTREIALHFMNLMKEFFDEVAESVAMDDEEPETFEDFIEKIRHSHKSDD